MTIDMSIIERANELGRAAERQKMADLASIMSNQSLANLAGKGHFVPANTSKDRGGKGGGTLSHPTKAAAPVASGVKKALGPRTKGVKEAILSLIASGSMSPAAIIAETGFKSTSVRATLMSLKKSGLAMSGDGRWIATNPVGHGNSEVDVHMGTLPLNPLG